MKTVVKLGLNELSRHMAQQIGAALGLAVFTTIALTAVSGTGGREQPVRL